MKYQTNWNATREYLESLGVRISIIADYHDEYSGSVITMPDGDVHGCDFHELKSSLVDSEAYAVSKAFKLLFPLTIKYNKAMKEEEKAKELIERFKEPILVSPEEDVCMTFKTLDDKQAKQCALICVDEILDLDSGDSVDEDYWLKVKNYLI